MSFANRDLTLKYSPPTSCTDTGKHSHCRFLFLNMFGYVNDKILVVLLFISFIGFFAFCQLSICHNVNVFFAVKKLYIVNNECIISYSFMYLRIIIVLLFLIFVPVFLTWHINICEVAFIQFALNRPATARINPWWCYMTADGKWHPAADPPVGAALPWPPWNASAGVPPVCLWRASRKADGASRHHCREQGRGQVCPGLFLTLSNILRWNQMGCYCALFSFTPPTDTGNWKSCWRRAFPLSKCHPFSL